MKNLKIEFNKDGVEPSISNSNFDVLPLHHLFNNKINNKIFYSQPHVPVRSPC